jgi:small subunit ribosomal protein S6
MRRYETIFIITPDSPEEDLNAVATKFQDMVASMDGIVASYQDQGKKRLAYSVRKQDKGFYVLMDYIGSSDLVAEVERNMRLDDRILKYLTVKLSDKLDPASIKEHVPEPKKPAESAEDPEPEKDSKLETKESEEDPTSEAEEPVQDPTPEIKETQERSE